MSIYNICGIFILGITLSSCGFTSFGDNIREGVSTKGAQAYDEGLANSEWFMCEATSVGSAKRRYGGDAEKANAWKVICEGEDNVDILTPN